MSTSAAMEKSMSRNIENTQEDDESFNRIKQFKSNLLKELKLYLPIEPIIDHILSYSNHTQIHNLWLNMHKKLGKYSFIMRPGCKLSDIQKFEMDYNLTLSADLRVSYLICDAVMFPTKFRDYQRQKESNHPTPQPLNMAPECIMTPISTWTRLNLESIPYHEFSYQSGWDYHYWRSQDEYNDFVSVFLGCDRDLEEYAAEKHNKIFAIGGTCSRWPGGSMWLLWSAETNKIFSIYRTDEFFSTILHGKVYDSFQDYLERWCEFIYCNINTFKGKCLQIGDRKHIVEII